MNCDNNPIKWVLILSPCCRSGNQGLERLSDDVLTVIKAGSGGAEIHTQAVCVPSVWGSHRPCEALRATLDSPWTPAS